MKKAKLVKDEEPIEIEVLESAIVALSNIGKKLDSSRLKQRTVILLLQDAIGAGNIAKRQIEAVLDTLPELEARYLKTKKPCPK